MLKNIKGYHLFLAAAIVFYTASFYTGSTVHVVISDTELIIELSRVRVLLAALSAACWLFYLCFNRLLYSALLKQLHIILTLFSLTALAFLDLWFLPFSSPVAENLSLLNNLTKVFIAIVFFFCLAQVLLPVQFISGIASKLPGEKRRYTG